MTFQSAVLLPTQSRLPPPPHIKGSSSAPGPLCFECKHLEFWSVPFLVAFLLVAWSFLKVSLNLFWLFFIVALKNDFQRLNVINSELVRCTC